MEKVCIVCETIYELKKCPKYCWICGAPIEIIEKNGKKKKET
jgi:rRNA maturation endonuclease Nob1